MAKKPKYDRPPVTVAQAIRDIFVTAINKGQLLLILGFLIVLVLVIKMPSEMAGTLVVDIEHDLRDMHVLGWVLEVLTLIAAVLLNRRQRRTYRNEINRISEEKTELQRLAGLDKDFVKSSRSK